ncbi:unnamed protein product [Adineta ricciae]|uniref:Beta-lactamase-related domain-containing protein n=1 Tax=Adineta ricciae TaxID=249248 RepID=A0A815M0Z8_ADIRI|nr:unnamed protein product [Adineta ricciae]
MYFLLLTFPLFVISYKLIDHNIQGEIAPGWEFVSDLFRDNFIKDRDLGASVAIYHQGKPVVSLTGGWFDESKTKPYDSAALQIVFSTSKGIVAAAVALAVQRGLLDYSALVTDYWPEYGQNGKENTTVSDILSHRAGVPDVSASYEDYLDWTKMIHKLEQQSPAWLPGTAHNYHPLTYGWLAGELIRRVDRKRRSLGEFVHEEISSPSNLEFYIGLPSAQEHRVSPLEFNQITKDFQNASLDESINFFNEAHLHQAEIPAANGITNAWSVARFYALLIGDVDDGRYRRIISEDILKIATKSNTPYVELDSVSQSSISFGMGFMNFDRILPRLGSGSFGHFGAGGSIGLAAPAYNLSFAYVMNRLDATVAGLNNRIEPILTKVAEKLNQ